MIEFSDKIGFWSPLIFWFVTINVFACLLFTIAVIIGGCFDLSFLFRALRDEDVDETDDGRVPESRATNDKQKTGRVGNE